jgi:hypothetical protein
MLSQVLHEIESAHGPITTGELSRKMGIDPAALDGMIQFWVRKGRLQMDEKQTSETNCSCGTLSSSCAPISDCVFIAKMPNSYSVTNRDNR